MYLEEVNSSLPEILTADNYGEVLDKYIEAYHLWELALLKESLDSIKVYCEGISEYTYGVAGARKGGAELSDGISELKKETDKLLDELFTVDIDNLTEFIKAEDNPRIAAAAGDMQMDKSVGLIAGVILMRFEYSIPMVLLCAYIRCGNADYFAVNAMLVRKLKNISPAEVLKNRE